jgi:hypothetical protein
MPTTRLAVNVDLLTDTHRLSCRVPVGSTGLITALNDPVHSMLEAEDVYYSRLQQPAKIISRFETASLNKNSLSLVVVTRREDLGPQGIARGGYTRVESVPVTVATDQFEVTGAVEILKQFDATELLFGGSARYLPLYSATAVPTQFPETSYAGAVILVNRHRVTLVAPLPRAKT